MFLISFFTVLTVLIFSNRRAAIHDTRWTQIWTRTFLMLHFQILFDFCLFLNKFWLIGRDLPVRGHWTQKAKPISPTQYLFLIENRSFVAFVRWCGIFNSVQKIKTSHEVCSTWNKRSTRLTNARLFTRVYFAFMSELSFWNLWCFKADAA